jgi:hypothetical protein
MRFKLASPTGLTAAADDLWVFGGELVYAAFGQDELPYYHRRVA